jgi:hypothetical protein
MRAMRIQQSAKGRDPKPSVTSSFNVGAIAALVTLTLFALYFSVAENPTGITTWHAPVPTGNHHGSDNLDAPQTHKSTLDNVISIRDFPPDLTESKERELLLAAGMDKEKYFALMRRSLNTNATCSKTCAGGNNGMCLQASGDMRLLKPAGILAHGYK